ncbi:minor capsid protein [Candidatus Pacearchaeota archaeon]|jgi:hypothetical protein|nr:minor capsid protein [Candidatus Pacearchaeota archaeon]
MTVTVENVLDEVAAYLATQGYGTVGTDIGVNFMKDLPNPFIGVMSTGGPKLDNANRIIRFQLLVRHDKKATAMANACAIWALFSPSAVNVLATIKGIIKPDTEVGTPWLDAKQNTVYSLNFYLRRAGY